MHQLCWWTILWQSPPPPPPPKKKIIIIIKYTNRRLSGQGVMERGWGSVELLCNFNEQILQRSLPTVLLWVSGTGPSWPRPLENPSTLHSCVRCWKLPCIPSTFKQLACGKALPHCWCHCRWGRGPHEPLSPSTSSWEGGTAPHLADTVSSQCILTYPFRTTWQPCPCQSQEWEVFGHCYEVGEGGKYLDIVMR